MDLRQQLREDVNTLQNLLDNDVQVVSPEHPERRQSVIEMLERSRDQGRRRGGPTRDLLFRLRTIVPGDFETTQTSSKPDLITELLRNLQPRPRDDIQDPLAAPAVPVVVEGWERFFQNQDEEYAPTTMLLLRRKRLEHLPNNEVVGLLLDEQDNLEHAQEMNDGPTLRYLRENLQEMTSNPAGLPADVPDETVWYVYRACLQQEIRSRSRPMPVNPSSVQDLTQERSITRDKTPTKEHASSATSESSGSDHTSTDSDINSYAPNKSFSLKNYKTDKKSRKRKHKKKSKRKRKRSRKHKKHHSSSSSSEDSESSDDEQKPNSRRVSSAAYDSTHYERLREFREGFKAFVKDGEPNEWPDDEALRFISKKFAREGSMFADKRKGVKRVFRTQDQINHARKKTNMIYRMSDEVAALRLERNEQLARVARRAKGASAAKARRIKARASKFKSASVREEQALVARIGVYCDLVLLGKRSWDNYHSELDLGGQREAVVESMGGMVTKSVAAKAWKSAQSNAVTATSLKPKPKEKGRTCYWCASQSHAGRNCPELKAGKPCKPHSRAAKWPKSQRDNVMSMHKRKVKIEKP